MATVKVFLSFEFDKDKELQPNFYEQAKEHSDYKIKNYSLKEASQPNDNSWLREAKRQIALSDIVIVVLGQDTHNAPGVKKEVTIANQKGKPMFQTRPQKRTSGAVPGAREVITWDWKKIDAKISEYLNK